MPKDQQLRTGAGLAAALRVSIARLSRRLRAAATADHALSATQVAALSALDRHGRMTPGELAEHEKMRPPSMTRVVAYLEERGLVARSPHSTDRRQMILNLTPEGEELLKDERRRKEAWLSRRLKELTPEERATLKAAAPILERLSRI